MKIIGRKREIDLLMQCLSSGRPEFLAVYGRRRVGKTYLVREFFHGRFTFYATGVSDEKTGGQLKAFHQSLLEYGSKEKKTPKDWFEAFSRLKSLLMGQNVYRDPVMGRRVVFLDELPWMDTARSDFKSALDYFWNGWGAAQEDLLLIACGSATSWIVNHLLKDHRGFHNRITRRIRLLPFSLLECEELLSGNDIAMPRDQVMECYMTFGGIPYYLNQLDARLSLAQNIEELCFKEYGSLHDEVDHLFHSLYKHPERHLAIIRALAENKGGKTRKDLSEILHMSSGSALTENLRELEECGFIRKYKNFSKEKTSVFYQLIDPFVLFYLNFMSTGKVRSWLQYLRSPSWYAWRGNAFELVCLNHLDQIREALGIRGVETQEYAWRSQRSEPGVQIDLLIDRRDGLINLCEVKCTDDAYELTGAEYQKLQNRLTAFQRESETKKAVHLTLISANGVKRTQYHGAIQNIITGDDLFR